MSTSTYHSETFTTGILHGENPGKLIILSFISVTLSTGFCIGYWIY
jgi:hypothetical protein